MDSSTKIATRAQQDLKPARVIGEPQHVDASQALAFRPLPYRELKRRFWHMAPGLLAFGLHIFPHADPISNLMKMIVFGCCAVIGIKVLLGFQQIQTVYTPILRYE